VIWNLTPQEIIEALKDALVSAIRKELDIPKEAVGSAIKIEENGSSLKFLVNKDFVKQYLKMRPYQIGLSSLCPI